jgi:hypothetical protein
VQVLQILKVGLNLYVTGLANGELVAVRGGSGLLYRPLGYQICLPLFLPSPFAQEVLQDVCVVWYVAEWHGLGCQCVRLLHISASSVSQLTPSTQAHGMSPMHAF